MEYAAHPDHQPPAYEHQDQHHHQPYDPSQAAAQSYDPYYYHYPHHHHHHYDPSAYYSNHHDQQYYPSDHAYAAAYHQPGPAASQDSFHDAYAAPPTQEPQVLGYDAQRPGLNHAAVAAVEALSQLTQFAGSMDAAERARAKMHGQGAEPLPPHYYHQTEQQLGAVSIRPGPSSRPPFRGRGRRGGGQFRRKGSDRDNFSYRRHNGKLPQLRGRDQGQSGRSGGRQLHHPVSDTRLSAAGAPVMEQLSVPAWMHESTHTSGQMQVSAQEQAATMMTTNVLPKLPIFPLAWCDICRVDCNSLEILEQHKNGKRHRKTVQRLQELQAQQSFIAELQAKATGNTDMVHGVIEENQPALVGNLSKTFGEPEITKHAASTSLNMRSEHQSQFIGGQSQSAEIEINTEASANKVGMSEIPPSEAPVVVPTADVPPSKAPSTREQKKRARMGGYDRYGRRVGQKRKMVRFGPGGKRIRYEEPVQSRPPERAKERPRVCTVCNVMCNTQPTFESHLSGKKHISRIKRFQRQGTVYGPVSVYIPPDQSSGSTPKGPEPLFYGLTTHEMLQQGANVFHDMPVELDSHLLGEEAGLELLPGQGAKHEGEADGPATEGNEAVNLCTEGKKFGTEPKVKEVAPWAVEVASENSVMETGVAFTSKECVTPVVVEYKHLSPEDAVLPGLEMDLEERSQVNPASEFRTAEVLPGPDLKVGDHTVTNEGPDNEAITKPTGEK